MSLREPARGYLTGVANNPRSGWLEYFGCAPEGASLPTRCLLRRCPNLRRLPEDIDEWTIEDLRGLVVTPAPAFPAESPETKLQVTLADFRGYLESVGNPYRYLTANRPAIAIAVGRPAAMAMEIGRAHV